jgi:hypothetical protein
LVELGGNVSSGKEKEKGGLLYVNDVKGLVDGALGGEREGSINFGGNLAGDNGQDLLAELDQEAVEGGINLLLNGGSVLLAVCHSHIHQLGVFGLLGGGEDEGRVGGGILWLVLANGWRGQVSVVNLCCGEEEEEISEVDREGEGEEISEVDRKRERERGSYKRNHLYRWISWDFSAA